MNRSRIGEYKIDLYQFDAILGYFYTKCPIIKLV